MFQIKEGLNQGLDVSIYTNSKYSWKEMEKIRKELKSKNNI